MRIAFVVLGLLAPAVGMGACRVLRSDGTVAPPLHDALYESLAAAETCPTRVQALKPLLENAGLAIRPAMVANRGRHNPRRGSFSFFEVGTGTTPSGRKVEEGDFFFGHFTAKEGDRLALDQAPARGKLLVELIAWDAKKRLFNFYELIGTGGSATWFYRGDTADALADNRYLHRKPPPGEAKFGSRMRCSACHASGGPILKELVAPHNDWWTTERPLPLGGNQPTPEVERWLSDLVDAGDFSRAVRQGMARLEKSDGLAEARRRMTLPERLRPLFCDTEINLVSDLSPLAEAREQLVVPSSLVLSPYWGSFRLETGREHYLALLARKGMRFPETSRADADHAWLAPVKGHSDLLAIRSLETDPLDEETVADVLAVDMENPLFSKARCDLLELVPATGDRWRERFEEALEASSLPGARALLANLRDEKRDKAFHIGRATALAEATARDLATDAGRTALFDRLVAARRGVLDSEISRNPRGQILEPGFRIVFPEPSPARAP